MSSVADHKPQLRSNPVLRDMQPNWLQGCIAFWGDVVFPIHGVIANVHHETPRLMDLLLAKELLIDDNVLL